MKKIILIGIIMLVLITLGGVSAQDNSTLENIQEDVFEAESSEDSLEINDMESDVDDIIKTPSLKDEGLKSERENFTIEFYDDYHLYGENNIFGFLMPKDIENNVSVLIDGKSYDYKVYDITPDQWVWGGDAKTQMGYMVAFSDLSIGEHEVTISYPGDNLYGESSLVKNITVHDGIDDDYKMISKLTAANFTAYYNTGRNLVAALRDENGNPIKNAEIQVTLKGKTQKLETDSEGRVSMTTSKWVPGSYVVTFTFSGDDYFTDSTVKAKVIIKKAIPKITAAKKTFKKSLKTKKYAVTLKANGKAMKNAKVYLKVRGKTYATTTNKNGKATFKITKLTKKGTHKATVTYKGNGNYAKKVVSAKITVK